MSVSRYLILLIFLAVLAAGMVMLVLSGQEAPEPQIIEVCRGEDLVYVLVSEDSNDPIAMTAIPSAPQCRGESEQP